MPGKTHEKIEVKHTGEGWFFIFGDREAGPFKYLHEDNDVEVAAELSGLGQDTIEEWMACPGDGKEKWPVLPKDVFMARFHVYDFIRKREAAAGEEGEPPVSTQISRLDAELVDKRVSLNAQIVSEQSQKALPHRLSVRCTRCGSEATADLSTPENQGLLEAVVFKDKEGLRRRAEAVLIDEMGAYCGKKPFHKVVVEEEGFIDYAVLGARGLLEEIVKFDQQVYQARHVHLVGVKVPPSKKVRLRGQVAVDPSSRDLCVLADEVEPLETQVAGFSVTDEDRAEWPRWFNSQLDISTQIAPDMVGREIVQRAYLLTLHSVPEIPDIHGEIIRGCLRVLCFGDTKTYKSMSAKDLTIDHYGLGGFIMAETSSRTGITYTIDTENRAIIWGELPNNDLGLTVIDGLHTMFGEEMKELRETLETQRIIVRRYVSGEALARTRVIGILNPNRPMNEYMYPCMAAKDNMAFCDPPDITRWDVLLPFRIGDVSGEDVARRVPKKRPVPEELFRRHVYWAWSRRPEHVSYGEVAKDLIVEASIDLMNRYSLSSLPIVHLGVRDVLCRLSVATAALSHSTDENHTRVMVDVQHVEEALIFYHDMLEALALGDYKTAEEGKLEISPSEFEGILTDLGEIEMAILNSIKVHSKGSPALAAEMDLSDRTIREHYKPLKKHGLITTTRKVGSSLTARGVKFLRALTSERYEIVKKNFTTSGEILGYREEKLHDFTTVEGKGEKNISQEKLALGDLLSKLKSRWIQGPYTEFDDFIMQLRGCDREEAERLRERWEEEGLLAYDPEGHLVWVK